MSRPAPEMSLKYAREVLGVSAAATPAEVSFTPVESLAPEVRQDIDAALARGHAIAAVKHYRDATGAGLSASKAAVDTYRWKHGGAPR